jgi:hypothetical protein
MLRPMPYTRFGGRKNSEDSCGNSDSEAHAWPGQNPDFNFGPQGNLRGELSTVLGCNRTDDDRPWPHRYDRPTCTSDRQ